ncbi:MAG TPA: peptidoglycan DD-metalloendopeptidase family protein [Methylomirabilota bacterium]|jgi:murein DD-endopeptidase MepM/ murein hydrolase activator NlpD|nr:peptidoglycan DD-metalloendopeptidase family protein [Methylomirabilota bacterium]
MKARRLRWAAVSAALLVVGLTPPVAAQPPPSKALGASAKRPLPAPRGATLGHVVRSGETVWGIAREHGVTVEALIRANRLSPSARLRAGRRLSLPLTEVAEGSQEPPSLADIVLERPPPTPLVYFIRPVPGPVVSAFGPRGVAWHGGVDLRAERHDHIHAAAAGMVITSGRERAYGRVVKIWHHADLMTVYAHNLENLVKVGNWVEQGQVIATVGSTGRATAPHLHFEIRLNGRKYNPAFWLPESEVRATTTGDPRSPTGLP